VVEVELLEVGQFPYFWGNPLEAVAVYSEPS